MNDPESKKLNEYACKDFWITAASWDSGLGYGASYEIGIRRKDNGMFRLIQSSKFNHQTVQEAAEIVCLGLDHGYSPDWFAEMFQ